jgi:ABC-2 type transport system ATP-binding protein
VFFDDKDRQTHLDLSNKYADKYALQIRAYCLMDTHVHLLAIPETEILAPCVGLTNQVYTQRLIRKRNQSVRIWQNRFYTCVVGTELYLWAAARAIVWNPQKVGKPRTKNNKGKIMGEPIFNPAINITTVSKGFGSGRKRNQALCDLSLAIAQGEVFGFLGPNWAGKSTTIKLLLRFLKPDSGSLSILGKSIGQDEFRHQIGYLSEFPFFYDHLTARETLLLSGRLSSMNRHAIDQRIVMLLERMNLIEAADRRVGGFSKGMKQRLGMANALIHDPEVLIFDEPMSGLDPVGRHQIKGLIAELKQQGKTIFFSSHILSDIEALCDRIGVINKGVLLYAGGLDDFLVSDCGLEERFVDVIEEANHASAA